MAHLYPNLHEKFNDENICPICLIEMSGTPKYQCENHHSLCHRCKPYYYSCPTCRSPLNIEIPGPEVEPYHMPPAIHLMPHPYPLYPPTSEPSAPFLEHEKYNWAPPSPTEDQELNNCQYSNFGCNAQFPEHLRSIHESRCQFRSNFEENQLPTDSTVDEGPFENCRYQIAGCNVKLPVWRRLEHEKLCIYKDKLEELDQIQNQVDSLNLQDDYIDPDELVECKFRNHGCMVKMPYKRKYIHQQKCNYAKYDEYVSEPELDPEENIPCCWSDFGCQVQPKRCKKQSHEEKCNYRREPCKYSDYGCSEFLEPSRRFAHENHCNYA